MNAKNRLTPQQIDFLRYYSDPKSETFSNALQSAKKAGYAPRYCENMVNQLPDWIATNINKHQRMLSKAEKALEEMLDIKSAEPAQRRIKQDTAKFLTERLNKRVYSNRTELTGKDGNDLIPIPLLNGIRNDDSANKDIETKEKD